MPVKDGHTSRIISGRWKGRLLILPAAAVRPSKNMVRQAFFNLLLARTELAGQTVADLCCGSGALGLEAASRFSAETMGRVWCVDQDTSWAKKNWQALGSPAEVSVEKADVRTWQPAARCDIVLLDAPYGTGLTEAVLARAGVIGTPGGWWVVETGAAETLGGTLAEPAAVAGLALVTAKVYGQSKLWLLRQAG